MAKLTALLLLCSLAALASADPDVYRRATIPTAVPPQSWGSAVALSSILGREWHGYVSCRGESKSEGVHFNVAPKHRSSRTHGLFVDVVSVPADQAADKVVGASDLGTQAAKPFYVWTRAGNMVDFTHTSRPAGEGTTVPSTCAEDPGTCAEAKAVPRVRTAYLAPGTDKFAVVPTEGDTCTVYFVRARIAPRFCRKGSNQYVIPYRKSEKTWFRVKTRQDNTAERAQAKCNEIGGDFSDITAGNKAEISTLAYRCLGAGHRVTGRSWNGDTYLGLGVQLFTVSGMADVEKPHVGEPVGTDAWPVVCKLRTPLRANPRPATPAFVVVPAPTNDDGSFKGVTCAEARDLCKTQADNGALADLTSNGDWDWVIGEALTKLGDKTSAWVRSYNADTYGTECLAMSFNKDKYEDQNDNERGGAITLPEATTKLHGAVCSTGAGSMSSVRAVSADEVEDEADEEDERVEARLSEEASLVRRSEL